MTNDELKKEIEILLLEVNRPLKVDSPLFKQNSYDFSECISKCGKLWARAKAYFEGQKLEFEIWESLEELDVRANLENINSAKEMLHDRKDPGKPKVDRITEARVKAEIKISKDYRTKKQELIEAEEMFNIVDKAIHDAAKVRGFISQAIVKKSDE